MNGEGGEEGFNNPTITIKFCNSTTSVLDEEIYMDETPLDSLNGACQFAKSEPSPFSSRRNMHDSDQQDSMEKTEQVLHYFLYICSFFTAALKMHYQPGPASVSKTDQSAYL